MNKEPINPAAVGAWFMTKWRQRRGESGVLTTAKQMRKQGIPLEVALFVLCGTK